ncbi:39S ribosomal protein L55, mitochondrial-like [Limulus polyphemus]|uniref:39S ribosomal protein L55, mitochondrial-like n=1 Tax=Limulus polyphemus TaxID=6850 RepID=A0ABM1AZX5_LIMPO|nr:39S ribosomal protein L55, mitochondrial-like [Limulus polyphemus]XP_022238783.1 39S ribosomal protein L55, mitochondrial-like [Limulus polyphemus]XP_022238791.1 39S ribosomal protein L55, mitochondrial-like [Limulus polyphemus]
MTMLHRTIFMKNFGLLNVWRSSLLYVCSSSLCVRNNSSLASTTKVHRLIYKRLYPTVLVLPDGSTVNIRYHEPRKIIKLPLDMNSLTEEEQKQRLARRKPKEKLVVEEEIEDSFDANKYIKMSKQKR